METLITDAIIKSISDGNIVDAIKFVAIFLLILLQIRGLKKELKNLNAIISKSFAAGETRMESIEGNILKVEHRLTVLESITGEKK